MANNPSTGAIDGSRPMNNENRPPKPHPSNSRRRTKTGCLTCRRRRIKCGEERPICQNCTKSKRNCEGYNQRVVFKAPMQGSMSSIPSHSGTLPKTNARGSFSRQRSPPSVQNPPLPNILPRSQSRDAVPFLQPTHFQGFVNNNQSTFGQPASTGGNMSVGQNSRHPFNCQNLSWQHYEYRDGDPNQPSSSNNYQQQSPGSTQHAHLSPTNNVYGSQHGGYISSDNQSTPQETPPSAGESESSYWAASRQRVSAQTSVDTTGPTYPAPPYTDEMDEDDEDDPYDVSSDDEMVDADDSVVGRARDLKRQIVASNLQAVMALQAHQDRQDTRVRTYHSVIENFGSNMLATYEPSFKDSPLNDPLACEIFTHFINVVAPGISMYERNPANASHFLQVQTPPKSQQHLWAYFLPRRALHNHALLHAMLALSSLHIAKLQDQPTWISLKHYHYAIRKLAKNVSIPGRRKQLDTLATTLLLGFYEVMSADHSKWCDHLLGSHQLIKNINFAGMTKHLKQRKMQEARQKAMSLANARENNFDLDGEDVDQDLADEVDDDIVSLLMGKKVDYGEMGEVIEDYEAFEYGCKAFTKKELEKYEVQRDLFWWFLKQDTIQSILSQNRLFLNYERWSHCPPRAPIGRRDAVHGTFDHLILLLGRLSDFASRDLKRKKRATGASPPGPPNKSNAPQANSVCAMSAKNAAAPASSASGYPPPGWQGPPPPGWTGGPPPSFNAPHSQEAQWQSSVQGGPPPGWKGPPPPGWTGGPPSQPASSANSHSSWNAAQDPASQPSPPQTSSAHQGGPPPGWQGPPPPGWTSPPPPGLGPSPPMPSKGPAASPPPGWQGPPPPGRNGPPPLMFGPLPPMAPQAAAAGSSSGSRRPPPPGWIGGPHPTFGPPPQSASGDPLSMPQLPPFAGMLPTGDARLPRGFSPDASSPSGGEDSDGCPDGQRMAAEEEWSDIGKAFVLFKEQLGPDFQELPAEYNAHIDTPFGPGIQYRGYNISVIWLMYYMGLMVWHRAHPSQLPSAMVAAAMTAHQTNMYANIIGRIAAGMAPDARITTTVAISTGSGLNDSVFSLFVAGVQYQDPAQRQWVIQRMLDTERLTGWETATQVAKGLETSWTTAAKMGRGPPYERYVEPAPVNMIWNRAAQRMDRMLERAGEQTHVKAHNEAISSRAAWATGILGIENKLSKINISSEEEETEQEVE